MPGLVPKVIAAIAGSLLHTVVSAAAMTETIAGRGVEVKSGDTLVVDDGAKRIKVRLADIDAPQGSDYFAPASRTLLSSLVLDQPLSIVVTGSAGNESVFGRVAAGKLDINLEMVRRGAAWVCWDFAQRTYYLPYENDARRFRRGLWSATWEINARARCLGRPPVQQPPPTP